MICGNETTMFGGRYICTRDRRHKGDHQTLPYEGRIAQWSDSSGSRWWVTDPRHPDWRVVTCPECGVRHIPDSNMVTRGGTSCFHCCFWTHRLAQYMNDELMVIEGTCYSWGAGHGFGGREFTITMKDGTTTTRHGLWCGGVIPWEYREAMPDNATFGSWATNCEAIP